MSAPAVLEREKQECILYQPTADETGTGGRQICTERSCSKPAVWEFVFHAHSTHPCNREFFCKVHTDRAIALVLDWLSRGPMQCPHCGDLFELANEYMKVVRIP